MTRLPACYRILLMVVLSTAMVSLGIFAINGGYNRYFKAVYPILYEAEVTTAASHTQIPPSLIYAVIHTESDFRPDALSTADAKGLMQLTDDTFQWAVDRENRGVTAEPQNLFDPAVNIHYGAYVLSLLYEQFNSTDTVLASYNAGMGRVREWLSDPQYSDDGITLTHIPYPETEDYVRRVKQTRRYYQRLYDIP